MSPINRISCSLRRHRGAATVFAMIAAMTFGPSREASAVSADGPCMQDAYTLKGGGSLNCTANDLSLTVFTVTSISNTCDFLGDTWTFSGTVDLAPRSNFRYDLGFYISHDGIDALTGTCTVGIVDNTDVDNNAGSVNLDGDTCGDFTKIANNVPVGPVTATCTDLDHDGKFDLTICSAYAQSSGATCGGIADAVPGTASKCQCALLNTTQTVPQCVSNADCVPDGNPCTGEICGGSNPDLFGCGHENTAGSCDDGLFCNGADTCSGGTCSGHAGNPCTGGGICGSTCNESTDDCFASASTVCRSAAGVCDVAETCTGTSTTCPANGFSSGNTCRTASGICDVAETCSGLSSSCPTDGFASTSVTCRASTGECDTAEVCSGAATCPADSFASGSTPCTSDGNVCTNDLCNGSGTCAHPSNAASCDDGQFCNGADTCSGGTCSSHAGDPCTGGGICGSTCNESTDDCFASAATVCRSSAGVCDVAENCTGA
ncbi:MAG TPA: hypothetical protein VN634_15330, partial [Candidatus Limnocylindrales bacterium]|nr:hypothetical protein [Candidatus Limnocylindrales bacterium]